MNFCVLITCYNKEKFIEDAIKSAQSEFLNVIVVDDCSSDDSREIINTFQQVKKIFLNENLGVTAATIAGLQYAIKNNYDFVILLDADDVLVAGSNTFFNKAITSLEFTAVYSSVSRSKNQDMRRLVSSCELTEVIEITAPLEQWLEFGKATTALCAKPEDILASIKPEIKVQDHQIGFSIHKNAKKIGYANAITHACSAADENNLSKDKYTTSISDIKFFNEIYHEVKNIDHFNSYAKRIYRRCMKLRHSSKEIGVMLCAELYLRHILSPFISTKNVFNLTQRIALAATTRN